MSYALLWIEALFTSLLWVAAVVACAARLNRRTGSRLAAFFVGLVPFGLGFIGLCIATGVLKFSVRVEENWFAYALSLFLSYVVCSIGLLVIAARRTAPGLKRAAATWPRARLALGLFTATAITVMTLWNMDLAARSMAESLRNEAGSMMLSVAPPSIADSRNAARVYERAFIRLAADESLTGVNNPFSRAEEPDPNSAEIVALLQRHEGTIKLLRKAATIPDCRFDHDYARPRGSMLLPELNHARVAAHVLAAHARSELSQKQIGSAVTDLDAIFQLSKAVATEPILVSFLVSTALDEMASEVLQDALPAVTDSKQLAGLNIDDEFYGPRMLRRIFRGEEAVGLGTLGDLADDRTDIAFEMAIRNSSHPLPKYVSTIGPGIPMMLVRIFLLADDVAAYRELMEDEYQQPAGNPYYKVQPLSEPLTAYPRRGLLTSELAPAYLSALKAAARAQAAHAGVQAAIAATRYRVDHGALPTALAQLVPAYLDEVPLDPFDGKQLRFIHKDSQWIIYSVGPDGIDDHGAPYDYASKKGDVPFVLRTDK